MLCYNSVTFRMRFGFSPPHGGGACMTWTCPHVHVHACVYAGGVARRLLTCYGLHGYVARSGHVARAVDCLRRAMLHVDMVKCCEGLKLLQGLRFRCAVWLYPLQCKELQELARLKSNSHACFQGHRGVDRWIMWALVKQHTEILGFFKTFNGA